MSLWLSSKPADKTPPPSREESYEKMHDARVVHLKAKKNARYSPGAIAERDSTAKTWKTAHDEHLKALAADTVTTHPDVEPGSDLFKGMLNTKLTKMQNVATMSYPIPYRAKQIDLNHKSWLCKLNLLRVGWRLSRTR